MRIGLDLDNTLADYAGPLAGLCRTYGVDFAAGDPKLALRGFLRAEGREAEWTRLQGELYGPLMPSAQPFPGVAEFLEGAALKGAECVVVSHRTCHPLGGQSYDLHLAAREWLSGNGLSGIPVHLETSKMAKLARISSLELDVFVDDLPELLTDDAFPEGVGKLLFDPKGEHAERPGVTRFSSWRELAGLLFG
jgi:hypothetical protein